MNDEPTARSFDPAWWQRDDLGYRANRLHFAGRDLQSLVAQKGTPAFVYSAARVRANLWRLQAALAAEGAPHRVLYALKANRFRPLLRRRTPGGCAESTSARRQSCSTRWISRPARQTFRSPGTPCPTPISMLSRGIPRSISIAMRCRRSAGSATPSRAPDRHPREPACRGWLQLPSALLGHAPEQVRHLP